MQIADLTKFQMNYQVGRVQEARGLMNSRAKTFGKRSASYLDAREAVRREEARLVEMTIQFFGGK